jgi:hypothetical protein
MLESNLHTFLHYSEPFILLIQKVLQSLIGAFFQRSVYRFSKENPREKLEKSTVNLHGLNE